MVSLSIKEFLDSAAGILTLKEAAKYLCVHPNTLRNWDRQGILKALRYGKRGDRRYKKDDLILFLKQTKNNKA